MNMIFFDLATVAAEVRLLPTSFLFFHRGPFLVISIFLLFSLAVKLLLFKILFNVFFVVLLFYLLKGPIVKLFSAIVFIGILSYRAIESQVQKKKRTKEAKKNKEKSEQKELEEQRVLGRTKGTQT